MKKYIKPQIEIMVEDLVLLSGSGPGATDIGAPSFGAKESVWDEEAHYYNIKEENYEVYE